VSPGLTDLVDDARAGLPEAHAVLGARSGQEVIHLAVDLDGVLQVGLATIALTARRQTGGAPAVPVSVWLGGGVGAGRLACQRLLCARSLVP
jgi:hypothetical protein